MNRKAVFARIIIGSALALLFVAAPAQSAPGAADVALDRIERILDDVQQIQRIMKDRPHEVESERERLMRREAELERERVHAMSAAAGISPRRVEGMRAHGMSWGRIARELDVDPRVVGIATGKYGERDYRRGHDRDDDDRFDNGHGKKKGWKNGMPPGQAKKHDRD